MPTVPEPPFNARARALAAASPRTTAPRTTAQHVKAQLAAQLAAAMRAQGLTKTEFARRLGTSRSALDRLLDAGHTRLTLATLAAVADALGQRVDVRLVGEPGADRSAERFDPVGLAADMTERQR